MKIKPLGDRVLIKLEEAEEKTAGGIILPDTASTEKPQRGEIVASGPGKKDENGTVQPMDVKVGDKILFAKYSGTEIKIDDVDHLILAEKDILAIVE